MQTSPIELDNYEVTPNRAKYPPNMSLSQSDSSHAETYAAEGLSQVNTLKVRFSFKVLTSRAVHNFLRSVVVH